MKYGVLNFDYDKEIESLTSKMKRAKARAWACIFCIPIWLYTMPASILRVELSLVTILVIYVFLYNRHKISLDRTKVGKEQWEDWMDENIYITGTRQKIRTHRKEDCIGGYCVIHNPSDHNMKDWPTHWREDRQIMERLCKCGVGHPDPDDLAFKKDMAEKFGRGDDFDKGIHGCCGCCMKGEK